MIDHKVNPLTDPGSWHPPEQLLALKQPRHEALAKFIHGCSPDPAIRTVATTALVLSLWQMKGRSLTPDVPSMLLIHAGESAGDPIDAFIRDLVYNETMTKPRVQTNGPIMGAPIELAPKMMENALRTRQALGRKLPADDFEAKQAEEKFHAAKVTAFGRSGCRTYTQAWHPNYGLLTGEDDGLILRLNKESDRSSFCDDLVNDPGKLTSAEGVGRHLFMVRKQVSLSGSLTPGEWKGLTAGSAVNLGWPLFALPHCAGAPLEEYHETMFGFIATIWNGACVPLVSASLRLPESDWVSAYQTGLRRRLKSLPDNYEFAVLQAVRQLDGICDRITYSVGSEASPEEGVALFLDLYEHALRGMVLGVVGLSWHGPGLCLATEGEPLRAEAFKLLKFLRKHGATSKSAILQRCHLKKRQRDILLEVLAAEDLVRVDGLDGATVSATTYTEFVRALYDREEFPPVTNHWKALRESRSGTEEAA